MGATADKDGGTDWLSRQENPSLKKVNLGARGVVAKPNPMGVLACVAKLIESKSDVRGD
jgi:hypothetical protein